MPVRCTKIRVRIPLNGNGHQPSDSWVRRTLQRLDPISIFKPGRRLGGAWTDDKVAQDKPVVMCWECVHKYRGWWKKYHYKADWGQNYIADCDGCGIRNIRSTLFLREDLFYESLGPGHGRQPYPGR